MKPSSPNPTSSLPDLTSAQFHILLTLSQGARHGYGIMQEIARRTDGTTELGPGTLSRSIKQLVRAGLLVEVDPERTQAQGGGAPRRVYALTPAGEVRVAEEARRLRDLVHWAEEVAVLEGGRT